MSPKKTKSNYFAEISSKSQAQLSAELEKLRLERARLKLQDSASRPKDTNLEPKIRRKIAQILTLLNALKSQPDRVFNKVNKQVKNNEIK